MKDYVRPREPRGLRVEAAEEPWHHQEREEWRRHGPMREELIALCPAPVRMLEQLPCRQNLDRRDPESDEKENEADYPNRAYRSHQSHRSHRALPALPPLECSPEAQKQRYGHPRIERDLCMSGQPGHRQRQCGQQDVPPLPLAESAFDEVEGERNPGGRADCVEMDEMADHPSVECIADRPEDRAPAPGPEPQQQVHPDRGQRVVQHDREVHRHPGLQERIEQQVQRIRRAGLPLREQRIAPQNLRAPQGIPSLFPLLREEVPEGVILNRKIKLEERALEQCGFPEERRHEEDEEGDRRKT